MIRYIKMFEVIFSRNNLSGMHISAMWHSWNVYKYFCPLSVFVFGIYIYSQGLWRLSGWSGFNLTNFGIINIVCMIQPDQLYYS